VNLAEELFLCALDEQGYAFSHKLPNGLVAALLAELVLAGRVRIGEAIVVEDATLTGDPLVDQVLEALQDPSVRELSPAEWIGRTGHLPVSNRIVEAGLATVEQGGRSWMYFVRKPDHIRPTAAGEEPRSRARAVLRGRAGADERTAALVGLIAACDLVGVLLPREERRAARDRASAIAEEQSVNESLRAAIRAGEATVAAQTHT
jgi:hypothetical protein